MYPYPTNKSIDHLHIPKFDSKIIPFTEVTSLSSGQMGTISWKTRMKITHISPMNPLKI